MGTFARYKEGYETVISQGGDVKSASIQYLAIGFDSEEAVLLAAQDGTDYPYSISEISINERRGDGIWLLTVKTSAASTGGYGGDDEDKNTRYTLTMNRIDVPLEQLKDYKCKWNYDFYIKGSSLAGDLAERYNGDTSPKKRLEGEHPYAWVKPGDSIPKDFVLHRGCLLPGVEAKLSGHAVVHERRWSKRVEDLTLYVNVAYSCGRPGLTFGIAEGQWLSDGCTIQEFGEGWELTRDWIHAPDGWFKLLYPGGKYEPVSDDGTRGSGGSAGASGDGNGWTTTLSGGE